MIVLITHKKTGKVISIGWKLSNYGDLYFLLRQTGVWIQSRFWVTVCTVRLRLIFSVVCCSVFISHLPVRPLIFRGHDIYNKWNITRGGYCGKVTGTGQNGQWLKKRRGLQIFKFDCRHYADFVLHETCTWNGRERYNQNLLKKGV